MKRLLFLAPLTLVGCATVAVDVNQARQADASSFLDPSLMVASPDRGTLRIIRDSGLLGIATDVLIYLDGRHVANLDAGRAIDLHVLPGSHKLGMQFSSSTFPIQYVDTSVAIGARKDFRVSLSGTTRKISPLN